MMGHFGFSYVGLIFLLMLFIPNIVWTRKKPQGYTSENENKLLLFLERVGEFLTTVCVLIYDDFNLHSWSNWTWWLIAAFMLMVMYECWWVRYFRSEQKLSDFYSSFLGIPLAGATLPVISFFLLGIYGKVVLLSVSAIILGIGHIGIHMHIVKKFEFQAKKDKIMKKIKWILCPVCGNKTRDRIREDYALVLESLRRVLFYVQAIEKQFVQEQLEKSSEEQKKEFAKKRRELAKSEKRIAELDVLFQRIYEDNVSGKLTDERFATMSASYEAEQKSLKEVAAMLCNEIEAQDDKTSNVLAFVEKVKRYTEIKELTPAIVNEFVDYIMVSKKQVINGKTVYPIDIYYNGVGIITAPTAEEYEEMFQERLKQKRAKEQKTA